MRKKFQPLNNYLQNSVEFATIRAKLQQNRGLLEEIQQLLPAPLNEHCVGIAAKQDHLILYSDSSAWASRLRYITRDLLAKLSKNNISFNKITVKITIDNRKKATKRSGRRSRLISATNSEQLQKIANSTPDPELRAALMRLSSHSQE
jgi:hypothetical protein